MKKDIEQLLTTSDVAELFKVETKTVRRLTRRGELPAYRIGRGYRYDQDDVKRFLAKCRIAADINANVKQKRK